MPSLLTVRELVGWYGFVKAAMGSGTITYVFRFERDGVIDAVEREAERRATKAAASGSSEAAGRAPPPRTD